MNTQNAKKADFFRKEIKQIRQSLNKTQKEVAAALGITPQSYQSYEWGLTFPSMENFIKLCDFLDVTPNDLLNYKD